MAGTFSGRRASVAPAPTRDTPRVDRCIASDACQNRALPSSRNHIMDIEHINAIGNALADLTQRTQALRGYL